MDDTTEQAGSSGSGIGETRRFLERLWRLENEERPGFLIGYTGERLKKGRPVRSALFSTEGRDTVLNRLTDPEKFLAAQIEEIEGQSAFPGDLVPALCPTLGVVALPSAFGCDVVWHETDFPSVRPLPLDDLSRIMDIEPPGLQAGVLGRILDTSRVFIERTSGRFPIRLADLQGPVDNAALIVGHTRFFEALLTHPREMHHLLGLTTDLLIDFARAQRRLVVEMGAEFVPGGFQPWLPDGTALSISNDSGVMLSPALHDEFSLPYLEKIAETFGGVYLHSCGNWAHLFPSLEKFAGLRGLEFGASETDFGAVSDRFGGRVVLACRVGLNRDFVFKGMFDFVSRILAARTTNRGLFIHVDATNGLIGDDWPETDIEALAELLG
ncbi:MAG: uroporphyrinogen decarboxylase family protein [Acidobacteriota bacterium]|nr:uroporphyrinogen decarboxylase family protein [Acidobacteriota bacterium]